MKKLMLVAAAALMVTSFVFAGMGQDNCGSCPNKENCGTKVCAPKECCKK
ncbi:hypothetical protein L6Q79_02780 [bacterium]|nr:hypothetical protein [bacterium]NUN44752.1 hypothetical protein [bacterium]